jgi:hypothetical protein
MPVMSRKKDELNAIAQNSDVALNQPAANRARAEITAPAVQNVPLLTSGRKNKVLAVRQQIAEGIYDVLDRLLERLIA